MHQLKIYFLLNCRQEFHGMVTVSHKNISLKNPHTENRPIMIYIQNQCEVRLRTTRLQSVRLCNVWFISRLTHWTDQLRYYFSSKYSKFYVSLLAIEAFQKCPRDRVYFYGTPAWSMPVPARPSASRVDAHSIHATDGNITCMRPSH